MLTPPPRECLSLGNMGEACEPDKEGCPGLGPTCHLGVGPHTQPCGQVGGVPEAHPKGYRAGLPEHC